MCLLRSQEIERYACFLQVTFVAYFFILKMESVRFSGTTVGFYLVTRRHFPEGSNFPDTVLLLACTNHNLVRSFQQSF
jgi:hypothetical protein